VAVLAGVAALAVAAALVVAVAVVYVFVFAVILSEAKDPEALHPPYPSNLSTNRLKPLSVLLFVIPQRSGGIHDCPCLFSIAGFEKSEDPTKP
jgi:hypothetical protein